MQDTERFSISSQGLKELHQGRAPWSLIKELVQNVWDEAPEATHCNMTIAPDTRPGHTRVTVEDDGPGFAQPEHAYMLMAPTPKRSNPTKRGRFNTGEKEAISVATEATIITKGKTIYFPESGGRTITTNTRERGTTVTMSMPWDPAGIPDLVSTLQRFIPVDCHLTVNNQEVPFRTPLKIHPANLPTTIQQGLGEPMRYRNRDTTIHILQPLDDQGWVYEMGIPIQKTDLPYDINVMQKVPMPPNRDTVGQAYLKHLSAEVLNAMHEDMPPSAFADTWVRTGIEDPRVTDNAVIATKENRYGDKAAISSPDKDANMKATEAGYQVINPRSISKEERTKLRDIAGVQTTHALFGRPRLLQNPVAPEHQHKRFGQWVQAIAGIAGLSAEPVFVNDPKTEITATCTMDSTNPTVTFNTAKLDDDWFSHRGADQLELIIHELAHARASTPMEHGPKWGHACAELGALIAQELPNIPTHTV